MQSDKEEIARKACLDILSLHRPAVVPATPALPQQEREWAGLPEATASKMLAVLAGAVEAEAQGRSADDG